MEIAFSAARELTAYCKTPPSPLRAWGRWLRKNRNMGLADIGKMNKTHKTIHERVLNRTKTRRKVGDCLEYWM